ncbi:MAG: hypothetical protein AMXMBFR79_01590 [Chitinophagaceae bacterium]
MKKLTSLLFVFSFFSVVSFAQKNSATEHREMYIRIAVVQKISNDSVIAVLNGGKNLGIQNGSNGLVKGVYTSKEDDRSDLELGYASVYKVNDTTAYVLIKPKLKQGTNKGNEIRKGDYVILSIQVPKLPYRSIFFELALLDIQFNDLNNEPLYNIVDLINRDSKQLEDSLLKTGASDVFKTYDFLKDEKGFETLKEPLKEGRYQGRSIFNVMADCKPVDVFTFLHFVKNYPGKYIGHTWKLNETFATWVMNKAPYSQREIYDSVIAYKNKPILLKNFITKNKKLIIEKDFITNWIDEASNALDLDNETKAIELFNAAKITLAFFEEECTLQGYYYYHYTALWKKKENYNKAILWYDTAYYFFNKCGSDYYKAQTLLSKGLVYNSLNKNDEAIAVFEKLLSEINQPGSKLTAAQKNIFLGQYHFFSGFVQAVKGELKKAVEHYINAIKLYKEINSYASLQTVTRIQGRLARIYKQQSELQKALQIYSEQLELYTNLNDRKNIADVLDNIADIEFKLANYRTAIYNYSTARDIYLSFDNYYNAGYSQSNIGQAYWNLGKYDSAIAAHQQALIYRTTAKSYNGLGYSWKKIGALYKETGEKDKALNAYDSSAYYYTLGKDSASLKSLLSDIGDVYYYDKQYQKAYQIFFKWHQLNIASKNKVDLVNSAYQLAWSAYNFNIDTSKYYFNYCFKIAQEIGDKNNELFANLGLGTIAYKEYDYETGEKYFSSALNNAIHEKNKKQEANCYKYIASAYSTKLNFDAAINYYNRAVVILDSLGEKSSIPAIYNNIANAYQTKGDFVESKIWYEKSINAARKINNRADIGDAYSGLSFLDILQGNLVAAQTYADSCFNIFKDLNNSWQIASSYLTMGIVSNYKNDYDASVNYYLTADSIYKIEKDDWSSSTCQNNIGNVYYFQADYDKALTHFLAGEKLISKIKFTTESHVLFKTNIGETYYYKKEYDKAEKYLLEGYKLAKEKKLNRFLSSANIQLGMVYYDTKKYAESEKYLNEGLAIATNMNLSENIVGAELYLGKLYTAQNNFSKAAVHYQKAIYSKNSIESKYAWELRYEYGLNFYNQNQLDSAIVFFKQAVELVEEAGKKLFGGAEAKKIYSADYRKVDLYNKLVASLAKTGKKEDALYYADKSNNQAIKEQINNAGYTTNDKEKEDAIKKGNELMQKQNAVEQAITKEKSKPLAEQNKELIASLESVQKVAQKDYINYINGLVVKYPDLQAYFNKTNPADFKKNMKYIPDSTLVVLYILNDNQLFVFTATNKEIAIKTIELKQNLNKQAERLLAILRNPLNATGTGAIRLRSTIKSKEAGVKGDFKTEASVLFNMLITPIKDQMKDVKNVCIIPNSKLSNIPFQVLGENDSKGVFHFLVEDYAIFYTNKLDIFSSPYSASNINSSFIALGNPDKSLPNASDEVKAFKGIVKNATIYTEGDATESKAVEGLSNYQYVHFATHGVLDYADFNNSYLVFAPNKGTTDDGKLTISKINGLDINNCSLVTLSACETAVSKEEVKGWYISPVNSFLQSNVSTVVASLWQVDDKATSILMTEFYKNLITMSKVEALRKAQETLSKNPEYAHPYFWSAFVLYGEWR